MDYSTCINTCEMWQLKKVSQSVSITISFHAIVQALELWMERYNKWELKKEKKIHEFGSSGLTQTYIQMTGRTL